MTDSQRQFLQQHLTANTGQKTPTLVEATAALAHVILNNFQAAHDKAALALARLTAARSDRAKSERPSSDS